MKTGRLTKLALSLGSVIVSLTIVEVGLRIAGWGDTMVFTQSDAWGYLMTPGQRVSSYGHSVRINNLGLRGAEVARSKKHGVYRIVYLGDSVTYGGGRIREDELFCRVSELMLARQQFEVEVVNVSAPGWSPQNWVRYVQANGLFDADLVVVILPECDLERPFATMNHYRFKAKRPFLRTTAAALKLESIIVKPGVYHQPVGNTLTPEENVRANLNAVFGVEDLCRERNTDMLFVFLPSFPQSNEAKYWRLFEVVANDRLLDLRHELNDRHLFLDSAHLSAAGHTLVGEQLYERIKRIADTKGGRRPSQ